jgi:hypothetical protein
MTAIAKNVRLYDIRSVDTRDIGMLTWIDPTTVSWDRHESVTHLHFSGGCASIWYGVWPEDRRGVLMGHTSHEVYRLDMLTSAAPELWFEVDHYKQDAGFRFTKVVVVDLNDLVILTECGAARVSQGYRLVWAQWHQRIDWQLLRVDSGLIEYETQDGLIVGVSLADGRVGAPHPM